jgi:hypothetical protein
MGLAADGDVAADVVLEISQAGQPEFPAVQTRDIARRAVGAAGRVDPMPRACSGTASRASSVPRMSNETTVPITASA